MDVERLNTQHFDALFDFEQENKAWFEQFVPARPASYSNFVSFRSVRLSKHYLTNMSRKPVYFLLLLTRTKLLRG